MTTHELMPDRVVRYLNGPRGSALFAASLVALVHCGVYLRPGQDLVISSGLVFLDESIPHIVSALVWGVAALLGFAGAFRRLNGTQRDMADAWGFGLITGLLVGWGAAFLIGWPLRGFRVEPLAFGIIYMSVAALVGSASRMTNPARRHRR